MLKVKKECCGKCLFGKDKIVSNERKKEILKGCKNDDNHFICHEATIKGEDIVCAEFYKRYDTQMIRISERLGMVKLVD